MDTNALYWIKDADIRIMTLEQGRDAVDQGLHVGGAFSAVVPIVSVFYSGVMELDVEIPTDLGQDMFVLSKGHAVAALASVMADLGYFPRETLRNSRSVDSILNGHPGPILPGVHIATGPEGHGVPVAQGLAIAGRGTPRFDVFVLAGDGEIQAGAVWEAVMYAGQSGIDNLCLLVDNNHGQLDNPRTNAFPMDNIADWFSAFNWRTHVVDAADYRNVLPALQEFKSDGRNGRPTAIICNSRKGSGGFSEFCVSHKATVTPAVAEHEILLQNERRTYWVAQLVEQLKEMSQDERAHVEDVAWRMNLAVDLDDQDVKPIDRGVQTKPPLPRHKRIPFQEEHLPRLEVDRDYPAHEVIRECMAEFGRSDRVVSVDSDLSSTSGLQPGVSATNRSHALNVGVAESNMISVGEAFAVLGYNTWVSTFCPFFDWRMMRRIAIGYQERMEAIAHRSWLTEGHNLDLVFLATAPNFETKTNGATHMGNDDALLFGEIAHLRIVDISCPQQLIAFMKWVMDGNRGLLYARVLRGAARPIYGSDFTFEFGRSFWPHPRSGDEHLYFVSSGRGVYEAIEARRILEAEGFRAGIVDMPSFDRRQFDELLASGRPVIVAEQNNGFIWSAAIEWNAGRRAFGETVVSVNTLKSPGERQFVHSATYEQLIDRFRLSGRLLAERAKTLIR